MDNAKVMRRLDDLARMDCVLGKQRTKLARLRTCARLKRIARQIERWSRDTCTSPNEAGHRAKRKSARGVQSFARTWRTIWERNRFKPKFPGDKPIVHTGDLGVFTSVKFV